MRIASVGLRATQLAVLVAVDNEDATRVLRFVRLRYGVVEGRSARSAALSPYDVIIKMEDRS